MNSKYSIVAVALVAALTGCVSVGKDFSMADVDAMQPGVTTFQDAVAKLGEPASTSMAGDGQKLASWVRVASGLGSTTQKAVSIVFGKDGKMIRVGSRSNVKTN